MLTQQQPSVDLAPGCYGSALAFKSEAAACASCIFKERCEPQSVANLTALRARLGVTGAPRRKSPEKKPTANLAGQMTISGAVREMAEKIDGMNLSIVRNMQEGINPFLKTKLGSMRVAADVIMGQRGPLAETMLMAAFKTSLGMDEEGAAKRARTAIQILQHVGAVDVREGFISIRRA
ncbi:hypothetical protein [Aureimonas sp. AU40]|uniref:hypothetical protein n=1 Tax=Aureimonas sp. AU40 TaxID=1637747 RepID=UPI000785D394|nr:hypothetical protein [Aureimonas sp. AU40]